MALSGGESFPWVWEKLDLVPRNVECVQDVRLRVSIDSKRRFSSRVGGESSIDTERKLWGINRARGKGYLPPFSTFIVKDIGWSLPIRKVQVVDKTQSRESIEETIREFWCEKTRDTQVRAGIVHAGRSFRRIPCQVRYTHCLPSAFQGRHVTEEAGAVYA
jgi:hypothetical protein